jgi:hypothetical protein
VLDLQEQCHNLTVDCDTKEAHVAHLTEQIIKQVSGREIESITFFCAALTLLART